MADSVTGFGRGIDSSTYTPFTNGDRVAADRMALSPLQLDAPAGPANDLASLLRLGTEKQQAGNEAEAEEFFRKALEIADRTLGPDHPELMLLLTDLTRLYLRKSAFAAAEPLLLRLLEMKRGKGEDHPEVATVLASLANVRQSLGRHESAEQLWRRVLEIRERTLAPNHFAIATALEHLGDSCAARGKIQEALAAFQRALTIRERTLGAEHPSMRVSRERIADLQLQASEDSFDLDAGPATSVTPERYRLTSGDSVALAAPTPPVPQKLATRVPKNPPVVLPQMFEESAADASVMQPVVGLNGSAHLIFDTEKMTASHPEAVPFLDALESVREELEKPYTPVGFSERSGQMLSTVLSLLNNKPVIAGIVVVVILSLMVVAVTDSRAFGESDQKAVFAAPAVASPRTTAPSLPATVVRTTAASPGTAENASNVAVTRPRIVEERPGASKKAPEKKPEPKLTLPTLSTAAMSRLDSAAARAASAASREGDPIVVAPPSPIVIARSTFGDTEQSNGPQRARLIGNLPTPRVPNQVADVEGEVRVRFNVDADGRPVMGTFEVVTSPNPLLTAAVRKVIPDLRFEPARSGGPEARPIADVVQVGFKFSRRD